MFLSETSKGRVYSVVKIHADAKTVRRLWELGMSKGSAVSIEKIFKFGGAIISSDGSRLALGKNFLKIIEVEGV